MFFNTTQSNGANKEAITKDSAKCEYTIDLIDKNTKELIIKNHYSHSWTSCRYAIGLMKGEEIVGVAIYGFPIGRRVVKSICPILENDNVLELTRLWIAESEGKNSESWFLGRTFSWLKNHVSRLSCVAKYPSCKTI